MKNVQVALDKLLNLRRDIAGRTINIFEPSKAGSRYEAETEILREIDNVRALLEETKKASECVQKQLDSHPAFNCAHNKGALEHCNSCCMKECGC
jgi:hypothetical protein